jgi:NADH-quinone oxidoreductase subunit M
VNYDNNVLAAVADQISPWVVPAMAVLPLVAALVLVCARQIGDELAPLIAVITAAGSLVLAIETTIGAGPYGTGRPGLSLDLPWIPALGVRFHFAVDGVSAPLVLLTAMLGLLVCWHTVHVRPAAGRARLLVACYLAVEGGALMTFTAQDAILFFRRSRSCWC